jgi:hypothetical protein
VCCVIFDKLCDYRISQEIDWTKWSIF